MKVYEIIKKKRDGYELSKQEIRFIVDGFLDGQVRFKRQPKRGLS